MKIKGIAILLMMIFLLSTFAFAGVEDEVLMTISLANQNPSVALAGDILEVSLAIENEGGGLATNQMVQILESFPFSVVPGEDKIKEIGTLLPYQGNSVDDGKIVIFDILVDKDTPAGTYDLRVEIYEEGSIFSTRHFIPINIKNSNSAEIIYIDQIELIPGQITPLSFTINNVGSSIIRDLVFSWENEDDIILPVGSDNTKYLKYIEIGESEDVLFNVIASANADPDLYKLDLSLSYEDPLSGEINLINTKAGVYVGGATDFDVAYSGDSNGEYSFSISNIGSVSASSVTIKIPTQDNWRTSGSNSVIIGNLNEGDYTIASFNLIQKLGNMDTTSKENANVKLEIVYTDSRGNRNTVKKEVFMDVSSVIGEDGEIQLKSGMGRGGQIPDTNEGISLTTWIVIGVIMCIIVIFMRNKIKKEKEKDPNFSCKKKLRKIFKKKR